MKKIFNSKKTVFGYIAFLHVLTIISILVLAILAGKDYHDLLLRDDGYYNIAKGFVNGKPLIYHFVGPGLPFIYSIIHLFPYTLHPFVRLFLSLLTSLGVIAITFKITEDYLTPKQLFCGGLIFIFNPVYVHFTFKSTPEIFLALLLGIFILGILNYYKTKKTRWFIYALLSFAASIFTKPVFLFIPVFLLIASLILKTRNLIAGSIILIVVSIGLFNIYDNISGGNNNVPKFQRRTYGKADLIIDSYWNNYVIKTKQFRKWTITPYKHPDDINKVFNNTEIKNYNIKKDFAFGQYWIKEYFKKNPNASYLKMNLDFVKDKPGLVAQKLLISPLFFLGMSARTIESFVKLFYSLLAIVLAIMGIRVLLKRNKSFKSYIWIILSCIIGFASLYLVLHSMNRYSLPILPYLTVWGGIIVNKVPEDIRIIKRKIFANKE